MSCPIRQCGAGISPCHRVEAHKAATKLYDDSARTVCSQEPLLRCQKSARHCTDREALCSFVHCEINVTSRDLE